VAFAKRLEDEGGVEVKLVEYEKAPHQILVLDGVMSVGRRLVGDAGEALREAFWGK